MMTAEEREDKCIEVVNNFSSEALKVFLHEVMHFSCVPRHVDHKNWCNSCEYCWQRYAEFIAQKYPK